MTRRSVRDQLRAEAPIAQRMNNIPEQETINGLPVWVRGLGYHAADDTISLRLFDLHEPLVMTSEEAIALTGALLRLVDESARNREIIDVDPNPNARDD